MPTIDNKVVQMTFDNKQFERGVKESLNSLEELKKALDLDKSAQSLQNLEKIASGFDISHIASSIDNIASKFTLVGNIGQEVFHRISKVAVDAMENVVHTITSMPNAGLSKYEQKNKAVQMIQGAMPEKSLEEIEEVLGRLNEYTDLTSYDFSAMASSIGKFTAAGVDLEVAERVMEGIANQTASAGGEIAQANIAMYNFSQALAAGSVKEIDWKSIENQNLATKEFKETIIDTASELGILKKTGDGVGVLVKKTSKGVKKITVDYQSFAETLSNGWFTSEVLVKTMEKYADRTEGVGKKGFEMAKVAITITQAFEAVKDAISTQWMKTWQYVFGDLEEAGELFTRISDALIDFTDQFGNFRNSILEGWHTGGEDGISGYTMAIEAMSNAWHVLMGIAEAAKQALIDVFGELDSTPFIAATKSLRDFTQELADFFGYSTETKTNKKVVESMVDSVEEWTGALQKGMRDDASDEIKKLQKRLMGLDNDLIKLDKHGADGIFGPETEAAVKAFQKEYGLAVTGVYDQATRDKLNEIIPKKTVKTVEETEESIEHIGTGLNTIQSIFRGVFSIAKVGLSVIKLGLGLAGKIISMLAPIGKGLLGLLGGIGDVVSYVVDLVTSLLSSEDAMAAFNVALTPLTMALQLVGGLLFSVGDGLSKIVAIARTVTNFDEIGKILELDPESNKNAIAVYNVLVKIRDALKQVWPVVTSLYTSVKNFLVVVKDFISAQFTKGFEAVSKFFTDLWGKAQEGKFLEKVLGGVVVGLKAVLAIVGGAGFALFNLGKAAVNGAVGLFDLIKNSELFQKILSSVKAFFAPVSDFVNSVWTSFSKISGLFSTFKNFSQFWNAFMAQMAQDPIGSKFVPALNKIKNAISGPISKIKDFVTIIRGAISLLTTNNKKATISKLLSDPKTKGHVKEIIKYAGKLGKILQTIRNVAGSIKNTVVKVFEKISPALKEFGGAIWDSIKNFFGGDGVSVGDKISNTFSGVFGKIKEAWNNISTWASGVISKSKLLSGLGEFGSLLGNAIRNFFTMETDQDLSPGERLMQRLHAFDPVLDWIKEKTGAIKDWFNNPESLVGKVKKFFSADEGSVLGALGSGVKKVGDLFKNIDLSKIWSNISTGLKTALVAMVVLAFSRISKAFKTLADVKQGKKSIGETVMKLAISLGIIAGALWLLAKTPATEALKGVGVMIVAIGALVGAVKLINKYAQNMEGIGKGLLAFAGSIALIVVAIGLAAGLIAAHKDNFGPLIGGLVAVGVILVALTALSVWISKHSKEGSDSKGTAYTIFAMCAGLVLVVSAIGMLADMIAKHKDNLWPLVGGFVAVMAILAGLGAVAYYLNKASKEGASVDGSSVIIAMCSGLLLVVNAIGQLTTIVSQNGWNAVWAFLMIEVVLATLGATVVLINKFAASGDVKGIIQTVVMVGALWVFADALGKILPVLGDVIYKIKDVDPWVIVAFLGGLTVAVAVFAAIPFGSLIGAAAGLGAFIMIVGSFTAEVIAKMGNSLAQVGMHLETFSTSMNNVDTDKISSALTTMKDVILPAIGSMIAYSGTVADAVGMTKDLWYVGIGLHLFHNSVKDITVDSGSAMKQFVADAQETVNSINAIQGIDTAKAALEGLGAAFKLYYLNLSGIDEGTKEKWNGEDAFDPEAANKAFQNLAAVTLDDDTLAKIKSYAGEGGGNLNGFSEGIINLGTALKDYGTSIGDLDSTQINLANDILSKAESIKNGLGNTGGIFNAIGDAFVGKKKDLGDFSEDIAALGQALGDYGTSIGTIKKAQVIAANIILTTVTGLDLPTTGGVLQWLTGSQNLGEFAANLSILGQGMRNYADNVSGGDFTNVAASIEPLKVIADIQRKLNYSGGVAGLITGTKDIGSLADGLGDLGNDLANFANSGIKDLKEDDFKKMASAIDPIKALAEAQGNMKGTGFLKDLFAGSTDLASLGTSLVAFGGHLQTLTNDLADFDPNNEILTKTVDLLTQLAGIQLSLQGDGAYQYNFADMSSDIGTALQNLEGLSIDYYGDGSAIDKASASVDALLTSIVNKMNEYKDDFKAVGINIDAGLILGMAEGKSDVITAAADVASAALNSAMYRLGVQSPSRQFEWIGSMNDEGLVNGMLGGISSVSDAAHNVATSLVQQTKDTLGVNSDSSVFSLIGDTCVNGFVNTFKDSMSNSISGIKESIDGVINGATDSGAEGINKSLDVYKSLIENGGIDDEITLTAVLDTSTAEEQLDGWLNKLTGSVSGTTNISNLLTPSTGLGLANGIASGNGSTIIQGVNIDNTEVVNAITDLNSRMDGLVQTIANMKVVMDTNALVGQLAVPMDNAIGGLANQSIRRG